MVASRKRVVYWMRMCKSIVSLYAPRASMTAIQACLSKCCMLVLKSIIRLDYIGHHNFGLADHLQLTIQCIHQLRLKSNEGGVSTSGSPDTLFDKYLALIPLLPATSIFGALICSTNLGRPLAMNLLVEVPCHIFAHLQSYKYGIQRPPNACTP